MNNFDEILEQCLDKLASGDSTLEACLARYPQYADELEPYLAAVKRLQRGRDVMPSPFYAARFRSELMQRTQPPRRRGMPAFFRRMALNVATLVVLVTFVSTGLAQAALPGESLYGLKLASENIWRMVTTDPVGTDIKISERRVNEYVAVSTDEVRRARVLNGYHELLVRLESTKDEDEKARILQALKVHQDSLREAGLSIPELDSYFSGGATETGGDFSIATPDTTVTRPTPGNK
jgi:hypothetical protein